jgi:hypothetical protein
MKAKLPRDPKMRHVPGYPSKTQSGTSTPAGYQKEARSHRPSKEGTKGASLGKK